MLKVKIIFSAFFQKEPIEGDRQEYMKPDSGQEYEGGTNTVFVLSEFVTLVN